MVFAVLMLVAFALVATMNRLTLALSVVGVVLAASYPYLKRYTYLPQVYLGLAFGWGIPMAFAAIQGEIPAVAWVLYARNILWATAYDTWYAMVDRDDDLRAGAKSTAILFGEMDLIAQGVLYGAFFLALWLVGRQAALGQAYWIGLGVAALLVAYEFVIARHRDREGCFRAFLHNHWVGRDGVRRDRDCAVPGEASRHALSFGRRRHGVRAHTHASTRRTPARSTPRARHAMSRPSSSRHRRARRAPATARASAPKRIAHVATPRDRRGVPTAAPSPACAPASPAAAECRAPARPAAPIPGAWS
jgi:hypothetical protein